MSENMNKAEEFAAKAEEFKVKRGVDALDTKLDTEAAMNWVKDSIDSGIPLYNQMTQSKDYTSAHAVDSELIKLVKEHNRLAKLNHMNILRAKESPLMAAISNPTYTGLRMADKVNKESEISTREASDVTYAVDILALHKHCEGKTGIDPTWVNMIEKLNFLLTVRGVSEKISDKDALAKKLRELNSSYAMNEIASNVEMGKSVASNKALLAAVGQVIAAMIGEEYKPLTHDVNYLLQVYTSENKRELGGVKFASHKDMARYMLAICRRVVLGVAYSDKYKTKKTK